MINIRVLVSVRQNVNSTLIAVGSIAVCLQHQPNTNRCLANYSRAVTLCLPRRAVGGAVKARRHRVLFSYHSFIWCVITINVVHSSPCFSTVNRSINVKQTLCTRETLFQLLCISLCIFVYELIVSSLINRQSDNVITSPHKRTFNSIDGCTRGICNLCHIGRIFIA